MSCPCAGKNGRLYLLTFILLKCEGILRSGTYAGSSCAFLKFGDTLHTHIHNGGGELQYLSSVRVFFKLDLCGDFYHVFFHGSKVLHDGGFQCFFCLRCGGIFVFIWGISFCLIIQSVGDWRRRWRLWSVKSEELVFVVFVWREVKWRSEVFESGFFINMFVVYPRQSVLFLCSRGRFAIKHGRNDNPIICAFFGTLLWSSLAYFYYFSY